MMLDWASGLYHRLSMVLGALTENRKKDATLNVGFMNVQFHAIHVADSLCT